MKKRALHRRSSKPCLLPNFHTFDQSLHKVDCLVLESYRNCQTKLPIIPLSEREFQKLIGAPKRNLFQAY